MRVRFPILAALITGLSCWPALQAQLVTPQTAATPTAVLPADQQVIALFQRIARYPARLRPLLDQVRAKEWVQRGAPETYATQVASLQQQIQAVDTDMSTLAQHPDRMQDCMRALFRIQAFHRSLDSVMGGLRKYQNAALADLIQSVAVEDQEDLSKLQDYILELATQKEQEFLVVDHEAQRCRSTILKQQGTPARAGQRSHP